MKKLIALGYRLGISCVMRALSFKVCFFEITSLLQIIFFISTEDRRTRARVRISRRSLSMPLKYVSIGNIIIWSQLDR